MIKAVIYDMDDLMVNSDPLHSRAWEKLLHDFNYTFSDLPEEVRANFIGRRVADISREIIDILKLDTDFDSFYKKRTEIFFDLVEHELEAMPGLVESLKLFTSDNLKIALASSGAIHYIQFVLDKFGIRDYFDVIISGDFVKIGKPNPETYLVASEKLGFLPKECVVLEDAMNGIEAAVGAGCKCIGVVNVHTPVQDHSKAGLVVNSLEEITLEKIYSLEN